MKITATKKANSHTNGTELYGVTNRQSHAIKITGLTSIIGNLLHLDAQSNTKC